MVINKRKKVVKMRGSKTHGGGAMKKRRGAGNRGGRGNAGSGKRGDAKKPRYSKSKAYREKNKGFSSPLINKKVRTINFGVIEQRLEKLVLDGFAKKTKDSYEIDLSKFGVDKLLGSGAPTNKLMITVSTASKNAISKVEKAGGKVKLLKQPIQKEVKEDVLVDEKSEDEISKEEQETKS
ncbi:50S ribosomal protein L15 [Candidatus Woesearchaeota archaeon]|nr:50S ribosomal protein L15 [Candidatus Woesearchaeota archaeon]